VKASDTGFDALSSALAGVTFQPYGVDRPIDEQGRYHLEMDPAFPFELVPLAFRATAPERPATWHTYLELFIPVAGRGRMRMGGTDVAFAAGDVLVVDHLKLHLVLDFEGSELRALVIRFLPELVRGLVASAADYLLLVPFYCQLQGRAHVLARSQPAAHPVHEALAQLCRAYLEPAQAEYRQTGARAYFQVVLHHLAQHFSASGTLRAEYQRQQQKASRLGRAFEHIQRHYGEKLALERVAKLVALSRPQFTKLFKEASGMTFVEYVLKVRLAHAARLLRETDGRIAEIAMQVGFEDPSYFDRRFRRQFGETPLRFRTRGGQPDPQRM
jgi:AraC-like DNA-binding protein